MRILDIFTEASQDLGTIISVAKIANDKSQDSETPGKMKMSGFINMLRNSGLAIDYDHFKTLYDTNPELKTAIQQYNDDEVVFSADETGEEETSVTEPEGEVPPEKKVNQMAKAALAKRESVDEDDRGLDISQEPEENPVASAILYRIVRQHPNVFMKYGPEEVMIAAGDVADMVGDVDEIGSSDVSIWTKQTIEMLGGMDESVTEDDKADTLYKSGPSSDSIAKRAQPYDEKVRADMAAGKDASWYLSDKNAGQLWPKYTTLWKEVEQYQTEKKDTGIVFRMRKLAGI